jgi:hypothetical protein
MLRVASGPADAKHPVERLLCRTAMIGEGTYHYIDIVTKEERG